MQKLKNIQGAFIIISYFILLFSSSTLFSQNVCTSKLSVENGGFVRSIPQGGTYYTMELTNTGNSTDVYDLSYKNSNLSCVNPDNSPINSNVILNAVFLDFQKNIVSEITVEAGQTVSFYTYMTIPNGTIVSKWSCNQIDAVSKKCGKTSSTLLHTFVSDPTNN